MTVSIILSPSTDATRKAELEAFKNNNIKAFSADDFKRLLTKVRRSSTTGIAFIFRLRKLKASDAIGIPAPECRRVDGKSNFSDDVFRIEVYGFEKSYLSVINVPRIFRTTEESITTEENKLLIKNIVRRYIENPRTIIFAVITANIDIITTEILDITAEVDLSGQRTLRILTKSDLINKRAE